MAEHTADRVTIRVVVDPAVLAEPSLDAQASAAAFAGLLAERRGRLPAPMRAVAIPAYHDAYWAIERRASSTSSGRATACLLSRAGRPLVGTAHRPAHGEA
jgi:hypothetical protein